MKDLYNKRKRIVNIIGKTTTAIPGLNIPTKALNKAGENIIWTFIETLSIKPRFFLDFQPNPIYKAALRTNT